MKKPRIIRGFFEGAITDKPRFYTITVSTVICLRA
jgi:hypothetical protein